MSCQPHIFFKEASHLVSLFTGNANEVVYWFKKLQAESNDECQVTGVDVQLPEYDAVAEAVRSQKILSEDAERQLKFVKMDAIDYLKSLPAKSADLITACGAEFYWSVDAYKVNVVTDDQGNKRRIGDIIALRKKEFALAVNRALKVGGFVYAGEHTKAIFDLYPEQFQKYGRLGTVYFKKSDFPTPED